MSAVVMSSAAADELLSREGPQGLLLFGVEFALVSARLAVGALVFLGSWAAGRVSDAKLRVPRKGVQKHVFLMSLPCTGRG